MVDKSESLLKERNKQKKVVENGFSFRRSKNKTKKKRQKMSEFVHMKDNVDGLMNE